MTVVFSIGSRVEWVTEGAQEHGEITRVLTAGRHSIADQDIHWQASAESPLYLVETEEGVRYLVPHVFALKV